MKTKTLNKILGLSMAAMLLTPITALANGRGSCINRPIWINEGENNDSRQCATEFSPSLGLQGCPENYTLYGVHGNVKPGDTDFYKIAPEKRFEVLTIYVGANPNVTFDIIDEQGNPTPIKANSEIKLDMNSEKVQYIRVTTGIQGDYNYTIFVQNK